MVPTFVVARRESDDAIQPCNLKLNCFAEPVIGARSRDPLARNDSRKSSA